MKTRFALPLLVAVAALPAPAQEPAYEMKTVQFALLQRGPERAPIGEREIQALQEQRLGYLERLRVEDKIVLEGPVDGGGDLKGVIVLDVDTVEAASALLAQDPLVAAGRLVPEIHPWWTARSLVRLPENLARTERCWLGLLRRPANAPQYPDERLKEIQAGHMENIKRMADSGDLVLAGPMGDDGGLRGIFIFRTPSAERAVEQFRQDPAHRAGRLEMELFPWHVAADTLPTAAP